MIASFYSSSIMVYIFYIFFINLIGTHMCFADVNSDDVCSSKTLYSDEFFRVLGDVDNECYDTVNIKRTFECVRLSSSEGFVTDDRRMLICQLECVGYERMCSMYKGRTMDNNYSLFDIDLDSLIASSKDFVVTTFKDYDPEKGFDEGDFFRDVEIETFMTYALKTWPLLTTLIPLVLNQYGYYNFVGYLFGMFAMFGVYIFGSYTYIEVGYNIFVWVLCMVSEVGRNPLREFTVSYVLLITNMFLCFIVKGPMKFLSGFGVVLIYSFYIYLTFIKRPTTVRGAGLAMFLAHLLVMYEQMRRLDYSLHMDAFSFTIIKAVINVVLPNGRSGYLVYNVADIAYRMVKYIPFNYKITCWVIFIVIQLLCFVAIRCLLGVYVINALRFKADWRSYVTGGLLYSSGILDGVKYVLAVLFGDEALSDRRMTYSAVNMLMLSLEIRCAREFFILRCLIYMSDTILWSSVYSNAPKYLDMNIDMKRMAYPQDCASVWVSMKYMTEVCKHIKKLSVKIDNQNFKGLGFVNMHSDLDKANLLTIHHVGNCESLNMDGVTYLQPNVKILSGADDPIVSIELAPYKGEVCKSVHLLNRDEVNNVKQVIICSLSDNEQEPMVVFSSEFHVDRDGELRILSSLQEGDSGGPVFAALKDGTIRYAGAVSRTTDVRGVGHKFALITSSNEVRLDSDSDSGSPTRKGNKVAINFNGQRNQRNQSNRRNHANLTNLCNAQAKLMSAANHFGYWVVDVATEKGFRWTNTDGGRFDYDKDGKPDDYDEHKKKYDKGRRAKSHQARVMLERVSDLADIVFNDDAECDAFMKMVHDGFSFDYIPGSVVHFVNGTLVVNDNPDPNEFSWPD